MPDKIHICKECQFEDGKHSLICPHYTYKSWQEFSLSEQKTILEESAKQGAEDQDKLNKLYGKHKTKLRRS